MSKLLIIVYCYFVLFLFGNASIAQTIMQKFDNYSEKYILQQQSNIYMPTLTPSGFVYDSHVVTAAKLLYNNPGQENNSNATTKITNASKLSNK